MLNSTGPSIDHCSLPLVTDLQIDFEPLIKAREFRQFSIHLTVYLSSPYLLNLSVKMLYETVLKALLRSKQTIFSALNTSHYHDLSKMSNGGLTMAWASSLSSCEGIPIGCHAHVYVPFVEIFANLILLYQW